MVALLLRSLRGPCVRSLLSPDNGWRYASVSNGCQEGKWRDGVVPQKTLLSFTDVPKMQTLNPLKSQKTEGF
jgi:hypothetical protein